MLVLAAISALFAKRRIVCTRMSAKDEIESVVASGKEVTIHETPISAHGFSGSGFIAIDPQTGAGAYLIEGGARGGVLIATFFAVVIVALTVIFTVASAGLAGTVILLVLTGLNLLFKNTLGNVDPKADFLIGFVEFSLVMIATVLAPQLFLAELAIESLLLFWSILMLMRHEAGCGTGIFDGSAFKRC